MSQCTLCLDTAVTVIAGGVTCRAPQQTMSCACAGASIASIDTASLEVAVCGTKRQRTSAQRCSNASDHTVVTSAGAARTPAAGTADASAERHERRMPSGGLEGYAEADNDDLETSPAVFQSARTHSDRCAMQPRAFYGAPHRSSGQHGGRQTAVELRVQRFLQVKICRQNLSETGSLGFTHSMMLLSGRASKSASYPARPTRCFRSRQRRLSLRTCMLRTTT